MKKKILLFIAIIATLMCLFAISSSATEIDYSEKVTLMDGTQVELFDENKNPLLWFIVNTETLEDGSTKNTYASVSANNGTADNANSYVTYNINSTYGTNQMHDIYIKYWNAETSAYESIAENQIVVINLRGFTREYWSFGTIFNNNIEYVYHGATARNSGAYKDNKNLQVIDMSLCTNFESFGTQAFWGCSNLKTVKFANSVTEYSITCQYSNVFNSCTSLTEITIPDSVVSIGGAAFQNCTNLKRVYISENSKLVSMETNAFSNCTSLTAFYLPPKLERLSTTTDGNKGTFNGCTELYFVNDPDETTKPNIYYFPANFGKPTADGATGFSTQDFKNCTSLNETIVLGEYYTTIAEATFGTTGVKNVVCMGVMTSINYANGKKPTIYLCNSNQTSTDSVTLTNSSRYTVVVCNAEGNTTHLTSDKKELVSEATCVDFAVYNTFCFCGKNLGEVKGTELDPDNHDLENATLVSIVYAKYTDKGVKKVACGRSCGENIDFDVDAIFVTKGYSIKNDGCGITNDYDINVDALNEYKEYLADNGKTFTFGVFIGNSEYFTGDAFVNADGTINNSYAHIQAVNSLDYSKLKCTVADFTLAEKDLPLVMGIYVIDDGKVSYVQHEGTYEKEITKGDVTLDVVTITNIAELSDIDLALPEAKALPVENKEN